MNALGSRTVVFGEGEVCDGVARAIAAARRTFRRRILTVCVGD